jgi:hypothetical protein
MTNDKLREKLARLLALATPRDGNDDARVNERQNAPTDHEQHRQHTPPSPSSTHR